MARMIPPYISEDVKSGGEKRIFEYFQTDPETKDWVVIHSLGLARHVRRQYGEIDFVVLAPGEGVFCLEVKSGQVRRREGVWTFTNRYGDVNTKPVSPFMQARDGMFSLLKAVQGKFGSHHRLHNLVYRYGVMFPDIPFDEDDPEHEPWEVYDLHDRRRPVSAFIKRLSSGAHAQVRGTRWYNPTESRPTVKDVEDLVSLFRGDFERVVPTAVMIQDVEHELLRLTEEQYRSLDQLENNLRCLFEGGAGTGKTLIAMELARRDAAKGRRVLLLCYNRLLGARLNREASREVSSGCAGITANSFHRFLRELILRSSKSGEFVREEECGADDLYQVTYPLYALVALQEGVAEPFGSLIIDEGQDLITPEYLDVFDALVRGGLNGGRWAMFCDFHRQAIYAETSPEQMLAQIDERVSRYTHFTLTVNCRNTQPIGEETSLLSGFDTPPFLPAKVTGPPVDYRFYSGIDEERRILTGVLNNLLAEGVPPGRITVLAPVAKGNSCLSKPLDGLNGVIEEISESDLTLPDVKAVRFSTVHSFKGLENSVIIITDINELSGDWIHSLLYVGMSRARQRLILLVDKSARHGYEEALQRRIERLGTQ
jgi:hypothetical protein